ncbi:YdaS family helix-turn-helix protein [Achromobacter ruhlandii]|uniref:YdaS family helix-turn-helix protein n=1 Tax=Achromobacter ruhlandii TaxID=72557 RepID=UPI0012E9278D|nr:YdaS family helix-turn-helix protein [Achromobacter ruhlandii]
MDKTSHIARAITQAGGPAATAKKTGAKNYQTVQQWERSGNVPSKYALSLETASGVSRRLLCREWQAIWPDLAISEGEESHV